jgi:hypothetical protein
MRHGSNFNPEWGYVAPAPGFMRTARLIVVAAIIGATAGAATVFSLLDGDLFARGSDIRFGGFDGEVGFLREGHIPGARARASVGRSPPAACY